MPCHSPRDRLETVGILGDPRVVLAVPTGVSCTLFWGMLFGIYVALTLPLLIRPV